MSLDPNTLKEKVNIFVASSEEAKDDAQTLSNRITKYPNKKYPLKTSLWWKSSSPLLDILDDIINMTHDHDFAIVLLPHLGDSDEDKVDRNQLNYNCLYEAGLFTGALDADKNRVFLVTSEQELPSDLRGIFSYRFKSGDEDGLNAVGDLIAQRICAYEQSAIHPVKGLPRAVINKEELLQRETVSKHGGMLSGSAIVFINSTRPIEADKMNIIRDSLLK